MIIRGFLKTTLLDYPGHVAATVFLGGCNMRCVFCHNMDIVEDHKIQGEIYTTEEILAHLQKRKGVLDGVCITGGEPTLYPDLPDFIKEIKSLGLLVKLDTNGTNPSMLRSLIEQKLIDYVAMDIKSSFDKYDKICGRQCDLSRIRESVDIILSSAPDYEFRTTVVSQYHDVDEFRKIGKLLSGAKSYYLQAFTDSDFVPDHSLTAPDKETLESYVDILKDYVRNVHIRGVE